MKFAFGRKPLPDRLQHATWKGLNITLPPWVEVNADSLQGTVARIPQTDELDQSVNVQLVVEFYSR